MVRSLLRHCAGHEHGIDFCTVAARLGHGGICQYPARDADRYRATVRLLNTKDPAVGDF
jgi:hypothetical protein